MKNLHHGIHTPMRKAILSSWIALALAISGCGGGNEERPTSTLAELQVLRVLSHPSDHAITSESGYAYSFQPWAEPDVAKSVHEQSQLPGNVILWTGFTKEAGFEKFSTYIREATQYPSITHSYIYDEIFWKDGKINIGADEEEIIKAAKISRTANIKATISAMPDVILHPDFSLSDLNAVDVIAINVYPSMRINNDTHGCKYNENLYSNLLYCSIQKLRSMGFQGDVWYVYQAFGMHTEPDDQLRKNLSIQRETIRDARKFGVTGIVPWGLYLGEPEITKEPYLYQAKGTPLEPLVR